MARSRTIEICQLNITMPAPHSPARYIELFRRAYALEVAVHRGQTDAFRLGALHGLRNAAQDDELSGEIYRYTRIDRDGAWFNTSTGKPAEETDTLKISIPEHLLPNLVRIPFVFRPQSHALWFVAKDRNATLGPTSAQSFFESLFADVTDAHPDTGQVEVTAVPTIDAVTKMLATHRITRLAMQFKRPNADDDDALEQRILQRMESRKVDRWDNVMTSSASAGIVTDAELAAEAEVAARNGHVEVDGYDADGVKVSESTRNKPMRERITVDDETTTVWHALRNIGRRIRSKN